jgi:DNA-binding response OmpR family regulator
MAEDKTTLLIVDDSDIVRHFLRNFFSDYNFDVVTCQDGLEGIQKAAECKPALIFLDLMMPNLDGVKMLQVIKVLDNLKNIPVIVISGNTNRSNVLAAIEAGADRVISKPLQKEIIVKNMNELLGTDFLARTKRKKMFSQSETDSIKRQMCQKFIDTFPPKKENILEALKMSDNLKLKFLVHEIRGAGSMIGHPNLTSISSLIEEQLSSSKVNWQQIKLLSSQLLEMVEEVKKSLVEI